MLVRAGGRPGLGSSQGIHKTRPYNKNCLNSRVYTRHAQQPRFGGAKLPSSLPPTLNCSQAFREVLASEHEPPETNESSTLTSSQHLSLRRHNFAESRVRHARIATRGSGNTEDPEASREHRAQSSASSDASQAIACIRLHVRRSKESRSLTFSWPEQTRGG